MFCSKACEYAIRSMIFLAAKQPQEIVPISKLSAELDISFTFLTKILQQLNQSGLIDSFKGAKGGVRIAKDPDIIHLADIVKAVSENDFLSLCATGGSSCNTDDQCPLHNRWQPIREMLGDFYKETTLTNYKEPLFHLLYK